MRSNGVCFLSIRGLCIPRSHQDTFVLSSVRTCDHHDYDRLRHLGPYGDSSRSTSAHHHSLSLHHPRVLLLYDHDIMTFTILMTHTLSYHSLTLPGLSLDSHSFDYSSLSRLCYLLTQPDPLSLSSFYFY